MQTLDEIKKNVEHPSYYGGADNPYEAIKVLREWQLDKDAYLWNVGKYLSRAGHKDGNSQLQDLTKARWYLDYKIRLLEEQQKVAESVVDTLKKVPNEVTDKLTTMPDCGDVYIPTIGKTVKECVRYVPRHAKPDYTDDLVFRPEIHTPNIETAVIPDCADEVKF